MSVYFPISDSINRDAALILDAISHREQEIKKTIDDLSLVHRISIAAFNNLGIAFGLIAVSTSIAMGITGATALLTTIAAHILLSITFTALSILIHPYSTTESMIRNQWKSLFKALRAGNGIKIINQCQELAQQQNHRKVSFNDCLKTMPQSEITPFFHKTLLIGYSLLAIENFQNGKEKECMNNGKMAYSHYELSGFSENVKQFVKLLSESPKEIKDINKRFPKEKEIYSLDFLCVKVHYPILPAIH